MAIQAKSYILSYPQIITEVSTEDDVVIEWFCVNVILYVNTASEEIYFKQSSIINSMTVTSGISAAYPAGTGIANIMFFGISHLRLEMLSGNLGFRFQLTTHDPVNPLSMTTNGNLKALML